ncbi:MAG TPA: hypothetical protein VF601_08550 [Beijerinckiaceae bacterium]
MRIRKSLVGALAVAGALQAGAACAAAAGAPGPARASRFTALKQDASCLQARKKLWIDGRGWVVRRVALCR